MTLGTIKHWNVLETEEAFKNHFWLLGARSIFNLVLFDLDFKLTIRKPSKNKKCFLNSTILKITVFCFELYKYVKSSLQKISFEKQIAYIYKRKTLYSTFIFFLNSQRQLFIEIHFEVSLKLGCKKKNMRVWAYIS